MAKPLACLWPQSGSGLAVYFWPGTEIRICKGTVSKITSSELFLTLSVEASGLPREDYAAVIKADNRSVILTDLTTNAAVKVYDGKKTISGKRLREGVSLRDGMVVAFGSRFYQFNRAKRVRL